MTGSSSLAAPRDVVEFGDPGAVVGWGELGTEGVLKRVVASRSLRTGLGDVCDADIEAGRTGETESERVGEGI